MFEDGPANVVADIQQLVGFENRFHGGHFILVNEPGGEQAEAATPGRASSPIWDVGRGAPGDDRQTRIGRLFGRVAPAGVAPMRRQNTGKTPANRREPDEIRTNSGAKTEAGSRLAAPVCSAQLVTAPETALERGRRQAAKKL
jgi:hypothetical protein